MFGAGLMWCFHLASAMAGNWERVDYRNFRKKFVPKQIQLIVFDLEARLPARARLLVEYFGRTFLIGIEPHRGEVRYFGCWAGRSMRRSRLLFPPGN